MSKKILFMVPYPFDKAPSQRLKFEQYYSYFEENGFVISHRALEKGRRDYSVLEAELAELIRGRGFRLDYFAIRRLDLGLPTEDEREWVVLVAAWLGRARLIDNLQIKC